MNFNPSVVPPSQFITYHVLHEQELFVRHYAHFELEVPLADNNPWGAAARWITSDLDL